MASHLLSCGCGRSLPVEVRQAGEQIECPCGAKLDVPPLRQLRQLPVASTAPDGTGPRWSASHGAIAACLVLAGLLVMAAAWSRWSEPTVQKFNPAERNRDMEQRVDSLTPAQGWWVWVNVLRPLRETGFIELDLGPSAQVKEQISRGHFFQAMMLVLAAVFAAGAVAVAVTSKALRSPPRV
jgi:hypothetical protein